MKYTLILTPEAQKHLDIWSKSGQIKIRKKILDFLKNSHYILKLGQDKLNSSREIYPVIGAAESIKPIGLFIL